VQATSVNLVPVESPAHRDAARALVSEYLHWVGGIARSNYGLSFDIDAMVRSDIEDSSKFYPPSGRFYLVQHAASFVGVGGLKRLAPTVAEVQRMYVQPHLRGVGAGRLLVERPLQDARVLGYDTVRLESLRALGAAHSLYRSVGFVEVEPYAANSMNAYQSPETLAKYRDSAVFMEVSLHAQNRDA
jgi:GNAT superfamily N-acetyltransferase